jgi:hypothetical protein
LLQILHGVQLQEGKGRENVKTYERNQGVLLKAHIMNGILPMKEVPSLDHRMRSVDAGSFTILEEVGMKMV